MSRLVVRVKAETPSDPAAEPVGLVCSQSAQAGRSLSRCSFDRLHRLWKIRATCNPVQPNVPCHPFRAVRRMPNSNSVNFLLISASVLSLFYTLKSRDTGKKNALPTCPHIERPRRSSHEASSSSESSIVVSSKHAKHYLTKKKDEGQAHDQLQNEPRRMSHVRQRHLEHLEIHMSQRWMLFLYGEKNERRSRWIRLILREGFVRCDRFLLPPCRRYSRRA